MVCWTSQSVAFHLLIASDNQRRRESGSFCVLHVYDVRPIAISTRRANLFRAPRPSTEFAHRASNTRIRENYREYFRPPLDFSSVCDIIIASCFCDQAPANRRFLCFWTACNSPLMSELQTPAKVVIAVPQISATRSISCRQPRKQRRPGAKGRI